jgi:hypothetical protein
VRPLALGPNGVRLPSGSGNDDAPQAGVAELPWFYWPRHVSIGTSSIWLRAMSGLGAAKTKPSSAGRGFAASTRGTGTTAGFESCLARSRVQRRNPASFLRISWSRSLGKPGGCSQSDSACSIATIPLTVYIRALVVAGVAVGDRWVVWARRIVAFKDYQEPTEPCLSANLVDELLVGLDPALFRDDGSWLPTRSGSIVTA